RSCNPRRGIPVCAAIHPATGAPQIRGNQSGARRTEAASSQTGELCRSELDAGIGEGKVLRQTQIGSGAELAKIIYDLAETATRMVLAVREVIGPNSLFFSTISVMR